MALYDDYGRPQGDAHFGSHAEVPEPYIVDASQTGVTYICFVDTASRCVRRVTQANGITTTEFSIGSWENRAGLVYQPINTTREA